ncbi:MAG TPA: BlaI/MecI/CopY family transcriptional regulator [Streptosporangiaceae bacterium]|nr:BlaI/MecI/CopY family transcriptional regulator [Streptosporangiaceae bacterium]
MRDHMAEHRSGSAPAAGRRAAGALESEVLEILRAANGPLSPGEVRQRLATPQPDGQLGELSYSTVVTIVSRLHAKGLLARQRAGRGFTYAPVDEASVAAGRMSQVLGSEADHGAVLSRFVSGLSGRDARLLRHLLVTDQQPQASDPPLNAEAAGDGKRE